MKVLVTGANGLLGQLLVNQLLGKGFYVIATGRGYSRLPFSLEENYRYKDLDITNEGEVGNLMISEKPEIVIHAAAMTQVDECELEQAQCFDINVKATALILAQAELYSRLIIYISSDFVFDGEKGNYLEEDGLRPVNWYGFTKTMAESLIKESEIPWGIVRTSLVYGNSLKSTRNNIVSWVKEKLTKREKIRVVDDQIRTPTYVEDLAKGVLLIMEKEASGIFHISGKDILSPFEMAAKTATYFFLDKDLIERVNASVFSQPAKRPLLTDLLIDKARRELGYEPLTFGEGLKKMLLADSNA
jgi:dTDP-4-dehydrorhamnose reductase